MGEFRLLGEGVQRLLPGIPTKTVRLGLNDSGRSAIGYVRYATGVHYPSDIVVGALVGGAIGYVIPAIHRTTQAYLDVMPVASTSSASVQLVYTFN